MRNHNGLLGSYEGADGIKTGFICDSGFNLVGGRSRDGQKLVAVVLGETTGNERSAARRQSARARLPQGRVGAALPGPHARHSADGVHAHGRHDHPAGPALVVVRDARRQRRETKAMQAAAAAPATPATRGAPTRGERWPPW